MCPGRLTHDQYDEAERAIRSLDAGARDPLLDMLENGRIEHRKRVHNGKPAGSPKGRIEVTDAFFNNSVDGFRSTGERAWVFAHEYGPQVQRNGRSLIYLPRRSNDVGDYFDGSGARYLYWQLDANIFACTNSTGIDRGSRQGHCNYFGKQ